MRHTTPETGPPRRRAHRWLRRRWSLLLVSIVLVAATFAQARGNLVSDTKLDLVVGPGRFLARALDLWDPAAAFGRLQNQAVGYWFPMGPFFWLGDAFGAPGWVTQRLWWDLLLLAALWGFVKLAEALEVGTPASRLIGAVAFTTGPAMLLELATRSPDVVPLAFLPLALLPLVHGARQGSPRRAAALSALVVLAMGGINAAVTGAALVVPLFFLLTREPGPRRRALLGWWAGSVAAVTLWWWGPLLLQQRYGFDFTRFTETAAATTSFMSVTEVLRGTGFWLTRLTDEGVSALSAGLELVTEPLAVAGTSLVVAAGLAGLATRRIPERAFLVLCLAAGVATMGAGYAGVLGGPLSPSVQDLLDGPLVVVRNVHKLAPLVAVPLAIGVTHSIGALEQAITRAGRRRRARLATGVVAWVAVGGVLVAAGLPLVSGHLANAGPFVDVPGYWRDAATWLNEHPDSGSSLIVPASPFPRYEWGMPVDEPLQSLAEGPWVVRDIVPFGGLRSTRLLDGYEELFTDRRSPAGWAASLARSGIGWVVVRNDLDPATTVSPGPRFVTDALERAPGLERVAGFGPAVSRPLGRERLLPTLGGDRPIRAVEIFRVVPPAATVVAYDLGAGLVALGSTEVVQVLSDEGVLEDRAVLLASDDPGLADDAGRWVTTDDLRRRDVEFGRVHGAESYTLQPGERSPDTLAEAVDRLLPGDEQSQSHVDLLGARSVEASSYYQGFGREPGFQPYAAIDGDPATSWQMAGYRPPTGEWWQVRLDEPQVIPSVAIRLPAVLPTAGHITRVRVVTDGGSVVGEFTSADDVLRLDLPPGPTDRVRIVVLGAERTPADLLPLGLAEVALAGVAPVARVVVTPEVPVPEPPIVVLSREPADPFATVSPPEDLALDRVVPLPAEASYAGSGTAVGVPGDALDALLAEGGPRPTGDAPEVGATSTFQDLPAFSPQRAVDGDPETSWVAEIADPYPTLTLAWDRPRAIDGLNLTFGPDPVLRPDHVVVTVEGRSRTLPVAASGAVDLGSVTTDRIRIEPDVVLLGGRAFGLVGVSELTVVPSSPGPAPAPAPGSSRIELPCGSGPELLVDGHPVPTSASGPRAALDRSVPVDLAVCGPLVLDAGEHRITGPATGALQVESLVLEPTPPLPPGERREAELVARTAEHRRVRIGPGRSTALLTLTENQNPGWVATMDGRRLRPTVVDGWRQAWVVPPGEGGVVEISFAPGSLYDRLLIVGLVLVGLVMATAIVADRGRPAPPPPARSRRVPEGLLVAVAALALLASAGPVAVVVPLLWIGVRAPRWRPVIAVVSFLAIATLMLFDTVFLSPELTLLGQILAGTALAAALVGPSVGPARRRSEPD